MGDETAADRGRFGYGRRMSKMHWGAVCLVALAGCGEAEKASGLGIDAQLEAGRAGGATVGKSMLEREIRAFHDAEGRYPDSLEELAEVRGVRIPAVPLRGRWAYDPDTGAVTAEFGQ
jgi:hypothetical protein